MSEPAYGTKKTILLFLHISCLSLYKELRTAIATLFRYCGSNAVLLSYTHATLGNGHTYKFPLSKQEQDFTARQVFGDRYTLLPNAK